MLQSLYDNPISPAVLGGTLIGASSLILMVFNGRITGNSGIFYNFVNPNSSAPWQLTFLLGLMLGASSYYYLTQQSYPTLNSSIPLAIVGGLLVGAGTRLGSGCTSGHGVCGISRFSKRSLMATLTFIATGMVTVTLMRHIF